MTFANGPIVLFVLHVQSFNCKFKVLSHDEILHVVQGIWRIDNVLLLFFYIIAMMKVPRATIMLAFVTYKIPFFLFGLKKRLVLKYKAFGPSHTLYYIQNVAVVQYFSNLSLVLASRPQRKCVRVCKRE
eukprot:TRINITY_DN16299_c0_g1_i3.p8 TRINITY_DN16299_c0_g1~~TRINITY_DN16299_c0_g1_i3.p8  ORF type:complete len:129 (-),score=0.72 TRINITY_DN16299_c0_g1_i3:724-1110(-)